MASGGRRTGRRPVSGPCVRSRADLAGTVLLAALGAAVPVVGEADSALGGVEAEDAAGEGRAGLCRPEPAVEFGQQDLLASGARDEPDPVAAERFGGEPARGWCHLDAEFDLAGGQ